MARYDEVYERRASRAIAEGTLDLQTFIEDQIAAGVSLARIDEQLSLDLEEGGPIFQKFIRSLSGAAQGSVLAAERQGEMAGIALEEAAFQKLIGVAEMEDAIADADPERLQEIENAVSEENMEFTWVAELVNTCHRCLPVHGKTRTLREWRELGLHPDSIHSGWQSTCHCQLIPAELFDNELRQELREPLVRERVESRTGLKGVKRTQRAVTQQRLNNAQNAINQAMESVEGRRTLRLMGMVNQGESDD